MLKQWLLIFCLGISVNHSSAETVKGLDASETTMFYATTTHLFAQDLTGGNEIQKNFRNDSLFNQYLLKIAENFGNNNDAENMGRLQSFEVMNLTWHNKYIYLCIRYLQKNALGGLRPRFGFVAFDEKLNTVNYFSVQADTGITYLNIWPYHPVEFKDDETIYLQYLNSDLFMGEFTLNTTKHRVIRTKQIMKINRGDRFGINLSANPSHMMSPAIYMVPKSVNRFFFIHPFPVIFNTIDGEVKADPFGSKTQLSSTYPYGKTGYAPDFSSSSGFTFGNRNNTMMIMTSRQWNDSVFAVISTSDANKYYIMLIAINDKTGQVYPVAVSAGGNACYILRRNRLYQLNFKDSKGIITSRTLR